MELNNVIFGPDAKVVVDGFNNFCSDLFSYDFVVRDYFLYFSNSCSNLLVEFSRRRVNIVVCKLARRLYIKSYPHIFDLSSNCISHIVINEIN